MAVLAMGGGWRGTTIDSSAGRGPAAGGLWLVAAAPRCEDENAAWMIAEKMGLAKMECAPDCSGVLNGAICGDSRKLVAAIAAGGSARRRLMTTARGVRGPSRAPVRRARGAGMPTAALNPARIARGIIPCGSRRVLEA